MRVYISGKIAGLPAEAARRKFRRTARELEAWGCVAVNPFENGLPADASWEEHMAADLVMLAECDAIYMLEDWEESKGARLERCFAERLGIAQI